MGRFCVLAICFCGSFGLVRPISAAVPERPFVRPVPHIAEATAHVFHAFHDRLEKQGLDELVGHLALRGYRLEAMFAGGAESYCRPGSGLISAAADRVGEQTRVRLLGRMCQFRGGDALVRLSTTRAPRSFGLSVAFQNWDYPLQPKVIAPMLRRGFRAPYIVEGWVVRPPIGFAAHRFSMLDPEGHWHRGPLASVVIHDIAEVAKTTASNGASARRLVEMHDSTGVSAWLKSLDPEDKGELIAPEEANWLRERWRSRPRPMALTFDPFPELDALAQLVAAEENP